MGKGNKLGGSDKASGPLKGSPPRSWSRSRSNLRAHLQERERAWGPCTLVAVGLDG